MRYSFSCKTVGKAVTWFKLCLCELHKLVTLWLEVAHERCTFMLWIYNKTYKGHNALAFISTVYCYGIRTKLKFPRWNMCSITVVHNYSTKKPLWCSALSEWWTLYLFWESVSLWVSCWIRGKQTVNKVSICLIHFIFPEQTHQLYNTDCIVNIQYPFVQESRWTHVMLGPARMMDAVPLSEISIAVIVLLDIREPSVNKVSTCQMKQL